MIIETGDGDETYNSHTDRLSTEPSTMNYEQVLEVVLDTLPGTSREGYAGGTYIVRTYLPDGRNVIISDGDSDGEPFSGLEPAKMLYLGLYASTEFTDDGAEPLATLPKVAANPVNLAAVLLEFTGLSVGSDTEWSAEPVGYVVEGNDGTWRTEDGQMVDEIMEAEVLTAAPEVLPEGLTAVQVWRHQSDETLTSEACPGLAECSDCQDVVEQRAGLVVE